MDIPIEELPKAVSKEEIRIGDFVLRVVHLDNDQRLIRAEDLRAFFGWLGD